MNRPEFSGSRLGWCSPRADFGFSPRVQAQPSGANSWLQEAYATLAQADYDYKGHRVAAREQIHLAMGELAGKTQGRGYAAGRHYHPVKRADGNEPESQARSDAGLRNA